MSYQEETFGPALVIQHTGQVFALTQEPVTIGSGEDNLIILDDPQVSAHHATIAWQAGTGTFVIEDLGSAGGTYVNEVRIEEPVPLRPGDVIRVGNTFVDARLEPAAAAPEGVGGPPVPPEDVAAGAGSRSPLLAGIVIALLAGITIVCIVLFFSLLLGRGGDVPEVVIQSPADGAQVFVGNEIILQAAAGGARDITLLELSVDGNLVATVTSPDPKGAPSLTVSKPWIFDAPSRYRISAVAYTAEGKTSRTTSVRMEAVSTAAQVTNTPTPGEPTATPAPGEPTSTPTLIPTPTHTPEPGETVPPPPQIEYFQASPASITAGGCTTLQWGAVSNATEARIEPDVGGVGTPGDTSVCPLETTAYVLTATGPGGETKASTTVTVIGGLPNLVVDSINFVPLPPVASQDTEVQIAIRNAGGGPAGAFNWEWQAGSDALFDGRVYGLGAGEAQVVTVLWNPSAAYASLSTEARLDVDDEVPETDKNNNRLTAVVQVLEAPAQPETVTIKSNGALDGYWTNGGEGSTSMDIYVGNGEVITPTDELVSRGFLSFDLSAIPAGATVESIELRFFQKAINGNPYGKLGELVLEHVDYGSSLGDNAFNTPAMDAVTLSQQPAPAAWYTLADPTIASWVQGDLVAGRPNFQLRLRFMQETDGDGFEDWIAVEPGGGVFGNPPELTVTYVP